jgi:IPT/TIG domain
MDAARPRMHQFPSRIVSPPKHIRVVFALLQLALFACGCGGGNQQQSSPPPPPPPSPDFTLAANPSALTVYQGYGTQVSVSATAVDGFNSQVSVQVSGLPAGVSATPASFTLSPGSPQNVVLSATNSASLGTATAVFTGTSGSLSHSAQVSVSVAQQSASALPTRTRYLRSDAVTEYGYWLNTHWEVFHSPTLRFFVTDPFSNQVFVFDSTTETEIGRISVPGAYGIDETPDQSTLYVGTLIGDVYTIDPVKMQVTHRYLASQIGPYGYQALIALPLSNGTVALLGAAGGIPSVDGSSSFAVWSPSDNSITIYGSSYGVGQLSGVPATTVCGPLENIGGFALTTDRSTVILGSIDSDSTLCEVNASTGADTYVTTDSAFLFKIVTSPDGNYIVLPVYPGQVALYDAHTLNKLAQLPVAGDTSSASDPVFSADSQTLFVPSSSIVYAYSVATGQQIGWIPNVEVEYTSGGHAVGQSTSPNYEVADGTGLLAGPMEEGFGFLDTTAMRTGSVGTAFTNAYLNPATGPTSGGTQTQWSMQLTGTTSPTVYFGGNQASSVSLGSGNLTVTTPPNNPGPTPVYVFAPDGGMELIPDGFSYGPSILEVSPITSTADGGGTGVIYGYGFGPTNATTIPANLSVTVGGIPATIVGFNPNAYNLFSPPFLLQSVYYTIPSGTAGTSADVTVASSSGTTVAHNALAYLPAPHQFPLAGSQLVQGIYDPTRDVYYFTDTNRIQVFSLTQGSWIAPINIPAPPGATQRLWGIALSPDGSKLAVADAKANVIYLLDPANTSAVQTFPFTPPYNSSFISHPIGVAISNAGIIYITAFVEGGTGSHNFFKLDTSTRTLTDYGIDGPDLNNVVTDTPLDVYLRTEISSDNSRVFFNDDGYVFNIDTATDTVFQASTDQGCCYGDYDLTLSSNQTQFEASSYLYDSDLSAQSSLTLNDREVLDASYVYGTKLSPDGNLLFQPSTTGLDVYDGRLGTLLTRIALPFPLSANYDALVTDDKDDVLIAITGANGDGIAVLDLTSLNEPAPLPYAVALSSRPLIGRRGQVALEFNRSHAKRNLAFPGVRVIPHVTHFILTPSRRGSAPRKLVQLNQRKGLYYSNISGHF